MTSLFQGLVYMNSTTDTYKTIASPSEGLFKDKGSKFIAYAYPVTKEEEVKPIIQNLKKEHYSARHHCYAFRFGADMKRFRANDDGEPSGTAGKPILGQIRSFELTNILIVIVRYFGGTLLGVSGLINAYKKASIDAIDNAKIIEKTVNDLINIDFDYIAMNAVMKIVKDENLKPIAQNFDLKCNMSLSIRQKNSDRIIQRLKKIDGVKVVK